MTREAGGRRRPRCFVLFAAAATFAIAGAALSDQGPGWEPEAGVLGTITFYDANGMAITGGDLSQHPAAFYAAASGARPVERQPGPAQDVHTAGRAWLPQLWTGDTLTGATTYPNPAAPAAVAHLAVPVATGTAGDLSLADYISEFPNTLTTAATRTSTNSASTPPVRASRRTSPTSASTSRSRP